MLTFGWVPPGKMHYSLLSYFDFFLVSTIPSFHSVRIVNNSQIKRIKCSSLSLEPYSKSIEILIGVTVQ